MSTTPRPAADSPSRPFLEAIERVNAGDAQGAEAICRDAVTRDAADVNMRALLGAVLLKMRRFGEAEGELRDAIRLAPRFAKPREDLGIVLFETGRFQEAVEILESAIALDAGLELAHLTLGKAQAALSRYPEARASLERAFEQSPLRKSLAVASTHYSAGRARQAEHACREILRRHPDNVEAMRLLGVIAYDASRPEEAERLLRRAIHLAPHYTAALVDLGRMLKEDDRYEEAIDCLKRACALEPGNAGAHFQLASILAPAALSHEAIAEYRRAIEINPAHPGATLGLAHMLKTVGQQSEAIDTYRRCAALKPESGEVYWSLANLKTYRFSRDEIAEMESRLAAGGLEPQSEVNFQFALAKAFEDREDYERAWQYYATGNATRRMQEQYDPVQVEVINDAIIRTFDAKFLEASAGGGCMDPAPIFIVGLPRSGSTLIEQILASHSQVEGTSELPYLGQIARSLNRNRADGVMYPEAARDLTHEDFRAMGESYLDKARLHRVRGTPRFTDKMPNNFPHVGLMSVILPRASIIDARRHPLDSCLGCYRQLFARGQTFTYDLTEIAEYFLQYQRMMDYWNDLMPGRILTVQYEEVVADFEVQARRIIAHCGLPWEDACLQYFETERPVRTASSEQVRQPIYSSSVGHWRHYEPWLGELVEVLAPVLPRYERFVCVPRTR